MKYKISKLKIAATLLLFAFIVSAVISMVYFYSQVSRTVSTADTGLTYSYHYIMIGDAPNTQQWQEMFDAAHDRGKDLGAYVENWGVHLQQGFTIYDQLEMAIAANVDGIILSGYNDDEMLALINLAVERDISIITLITDVPASDRGAFISFNDYAIGKLFGQQLLELGENKEVEESAGNLNVTVLIDTAGDVGLSGMIYRGIFEAMRDFSDHNVEITSLEVGQVGEFEAEERIRDLFLNVNRRPDVLIALNATNTVIAMQSLIEYNLVGQVKILGTSVNDSILNGISQEIIYSTVFINERRMGEKALELLHANVIGGESNDYQIVNVSLIDLDNLQSFIQQEERRLENESE
ncbi:MAG: substrate-binding domain-containing protein [Lachnospiraceae bacterium]|nr:substrate-binding domain-containing protein [Lachnospiraceae bacterium]